MNCNMWIGCFVLFLFSVITLGCLRDEPFLDDSPTTSVLVAVNAAICADLAADRLSGRWILKSAEYEKFIQKKEAIRIKNGTHVDRIEILLLENGRLVPFNSKTEKEYPKMEVVWVTPKEGPYKGRKVCVPSGAVRTSYPPPL